jgi:hypothetical protein
MVVFCLNFLTAAHLVKFRLDIAHRVWRTFDADDENFLTADCPSHFVMRLLERHA